MGERFLRIDYSGVDDDAQMKSVVDAAILNFGKNSQKKTELTNATLGYVKFVREHDWDAENLPTIDQDSRLFIGSLALYLAYVRTQPENDRNDGIKYRPRNEAPPRLALQFTKLAFGLVKVLDPTNKQGWVDKNDNILYLPTEVKRLLTKVAHDTIDGFGQEIIHYLYKNPRSTRERLQRALKIPSTRCHRVLTDLQFMQLIVKTEVVKGTVSRGPSPEGYMVGPRLKDIMTYMYGEV
jgi:hypothetical protein